eukprot:jgi/Mesvir1/18006/Mv09339-RA.1
MVTEVTKYAKTVTLSGGNGGDKIDVYVDDERLYDREVAVLGGNDNDNLTNSGAGRVTMDGGNGMDHLLGGNGSDTLWGGADADTLSGSFGDDYLHGEDDADYDKLNGGAGSDVLYGGANDLVNGGGGDDILVGADGSTRFVGGPGLNIIIDGRGLNYTVPNAQGGTDRYAVCADNRKGQDWGCPAGFSCKLSDGRSPGHRRVGDTCLEACYASNIPVVGDTLTTPSCSTGYLVQASYLVSFATCSYNDTLDVDLIREAVAVWLGHPPCQVGVNATLGGGSSLWRRLLQLGELAEDQIKIAIESFASSELSQHSVKGIFESAGFAAFLAGLFEPFGDVAEVALAAPVREVDLGSAKSDPHFVSARGDRFDFVGRAERSYCVLSDERVHVNARLMGAESDKGASIKAGDTSVASKGASARVSKKADARTWMDQISVMYGSDHVLVDANSRPGTPYAASFGTVLLNGVAQQPETDLMLAQRLYHSLIVGRLQLGNKRIRIESAAWMAGQPGPIPVTFANVASKVKVLQARKLLGGRNAPSLDDLLSPAQLVIKNGRLLGSDVAIKARHDGQKVYVRLVHDTPVLFINGQRTEAQAPNNTRK